MTQPGFEPGSPRWKADALPTEPSTDRNGENPNICPDLQMPRATHSTPLSYGNLLVMYSPLSTLQMQNCYTWWQLTLCQSSFFPNQNHDSNFINLFKSNKSFQSAWFKSTNSALCINFATFLMNYGGDTYRTGGKSDPKITWCDPCSTNFILNRD